MILARDVERVQRVLPIADATTATPVLIMLSGLPGTGKSFLARKIAERLPVTIVESDLVRKILFPKPTYTGEENAWVHRVAHVLIREQLATGRRVIYDATNLIEWHRERAYRLAEQTGSRLIVVRTVAPESVVRDRLAHRRTAPQVKDLSEADWHVYEMLKPTAEAVRHPHLVVDTSEDIDSAVTRVLRVVHRTQT